MVKCENCNKKIKFWNIYFYRNEGKEKEVCKDCFEKLEQERKNKIENEKNKIKETKKISKKIKVNKNELLSKIESNQRGTNVLIASVVLGVLLLIVGSWTGILIIFIGLIISISKK